MHVLNFVPDPQVQGEGVYVSVTHSELAHNVKSTDGPPAGGLPALESNRLTPPAIAYPVSLKIILHMLKNPHPTYKVLAL